MSRIKTILHYELEYDDVYTDYPREEPEDEPNRCANCGTIIDKGALLCSDYCADEYWSGSDWNLLKPSNL